jgi:hypothetical protein
MIQGQDCCLICYDDCNKMDGINCHSIGKHFICRNCFILRLRSQIDIKNRNDFIENNAKIYCDYCKTYYTDSDLQKMVLEPDYNQYLQAISESNIRTSRDVLSTTVREFEL